MTHCCRKGASIVVVGQSLSTDVIEQLYNPQCFLQHEDTTAPPTSWKVLCYRSIYNFPECTWIYESLIVHVECRSILHLKTTRPHAGPVVYMSGVNACIWNSTDSSFLTMTYKTFKMSGAS